MKKYLELKRNYCMTYPSIESNYQVNNDGSTTWYTTLNLSGVCTCGKKYSEHPNYVEENEKRISEFKEKQWKY